MQIKPFFKGAFKTTSIWSLLFVIGLLAFDSAVLWSWQRTEAYERPVVWGSGGPVPKSDAENSSFGGDAAYPAGKSDLSGNGALMAEGTAAAGASDPLTNLFPMGDGLNKYKVRKGDTFQSIASIFGLAPESLKRANSGMKTLKQGDMLTVPPADDPVSAAQVQVAAGENLPDLKSYFVLPAIGWNWGQLHNMNAVDIANQCGTPVHAAAEGLVVSDANFGDGASGWNDGYGTFVLLEHPNGTKTRYAHLEKTKVKIGDYVTRGEEIGLMGATGNTHGPTGCHLHFEVQGAKNPFAVTK